MRLLGKKAVITGSSKGIGLELAKRIINEGGFVELSGRSESPKEEIPNSKYVQCDFADSKSLAEYCNYLKTVDADILVNNVGIGVFKPFKHLTSEDYSALINTNLTSAFLITQAVLAKMEANNNGVIVNISSVAAFEPFKQSSVYGATKAATAAMFKVLREETRNKGIRVINVYPGATATEIWDSEFLESTAPKMMDVVGVARVINEAIVNSYTENMVIEELILKPQTGNL